LLEGLSESLTIQVLNTRVSSVAEGVVTVVDKAGTKTQIPFGACVWATGVAMNPLVKQIQSKLKGQTHFRALLTDEYLRVLGSNNSIWAIGDAATIASAKALDFANELFDEADTAKDGVLSLAELKVCAYFTTLACRSLCPSVFG
jgi:NADH:ubiquinone reductase (non-electrogenic)